jgi:hypothetical protein
MIKCSDGELYGNRIYLIQESGYFENLFHFELKKESNPPTNQEANTIGSIDIITVDAPMATMLFILNVVCKSTESIPITVDTIRIASYYQIPILDTQIVKHLKNIGNVVELLPALQAHQRLTDIQIIADVIKAVCYMPIVVDVCLDAQKLKINSLVTACINRVAGWMTTKGLWKVDDTRAVTKLPSELQLLILHRYFDILLEQR